MDAITLPQSLFTVSDLTSLAGLVVAVYVIVSFLKEPLKSLAKGDWIVRPFTVIIALVILLWLIYIQGKITPETIGLAIINSFLVALIAGAAHDYIVAPTKAKTEVPQPINTTYLSPVISATNIESPEDFAVKVAASLKTGDRGEESPSGI
jgi:hypothetical protein